MPRLWNVLIKLLYNYLKSNLGPSSEYWEVHKKLYSKVRDNRNPKYGKNRILLNFRKGHSAVIHTQIPASWWRHFFSKGHTPGPLSSSCPAQKGAVSLLFWKSMHPLTSHCITRNV